MRRRQRLRRRRVPRRLHQGQLPDVPHDLRFDSAGGLREPWLHVAAVSRRRQVRWPRPACRRLVPESHRRAGGDGPDLQACRSRQQRPQPVVDQPGSADPPGSVPCPETWHAAQPAAVEHGRTGSDAAVDRKGRRLAHGGRRRHGAAAVRMLAGAEAGTDRRPAAAGAGRRRADDHAAADTERRKANKRCASAATTTSPVRFRQAP